MPKPGKQNAQKLARQASDMTIEPEEWVYEPPAKHLCDEQVYPVELDTNVRYVYAMLVYKRQTVHFSVEVQFRDHALDDWQVAYRIDTAHGKAVHEHEFSPGDDTDETEQSARRDLERIPRDNPWSFIDGWLSKAMGMCEDSWQRHLERWQR